MPTKKKYQKILIANRGEIAVRVLRTCKELGISTVGVHSSVDETSLHVKLSDESVCIGPAKSSLSYLNIPNILSATEITESDAIHPGFGFLSESYIFAEYCMKYNVDFIGPNIECIKKMGDKIRSKQIAQNAGLKVLTSVKVEGKNEQEILKEVKCLGLPVLIKASAGGGGKGMERIDNISKIMPTIKRLKKEAKDSFGDDTLFIEKYIQNPRHIEVQILADKYGNVIHLGERDCTIQKSYQKIIEESPCPIITNEIRNELCSSAVKLAKYVNYDSVGTVEFLFDQDDREFYFMEMNTRIQVEHPITEVLTGIDLIAEQIKISQGEKLKIKQSDIKINGHAIECRINAGDPYKSIPSSGKINYYYRPGGAGVRVDDFIYTGYTVLPFYDSMLSKVIAYSHTRDEAINKMKRALDEIVIEGISTNKSLHQEIISDDDFRGNNYSTNFLQNKIK